MHIHTISSTRQSNDSSIKPMSVDLMNHNYEKDFHAFLKQIYKQGGVESLANSLPFVMGAFVVTVDAKIVAANDAFLKLINYKRNEIYGCEAMKIVCKDERKRVLERIKSFNPERYQLRLLTKDKKIKYVTASPLMFEIENTVFRLTEFIDNTALVALQNEQIKSLKQTAMALSATIEKRDPYTVGHMSRTAAIAVEIAKLLNLDHKSIGTIALGGSIHDIGKIAIPIEILTKPAKLEAHEWAFIKLHPNNGYDILGEINFDEKVKEIVLLHHECQDGSGYPNGLAGTSIPLEVSIVAVADSLEAIAGVRPYHKALSFIDAIDIMKQNSEKYHPRSLTAACHLVESGALNGKEFGLH